MARGCAESPARESLSWDSPGGASEFRQGCSETEPLLGKERVYRAPSGRWNILRAGL